MRSPWAGKSAGRRAEDLVETPGMGVRFPSIVSTTGLWAGADRAR